MRVSSATPTPLTRSMINRTVHEAFEIIQSAGFPLPSFAAWTPAQWREAGREWNSARAGKLGWDVTDFGLGNFPRVGRVLFTLRNGTSRFGDKPYAEKIILGKHGQRSPAHFHRTKIEDIINRGSGEVVLQLNPPVNSTEPAFVYFDGQEILVTPSLQIRLVPGQSLCIPPGVIHQFWGEETQYGKIPLIGEVSSFCDDVNDNVFFEEVARFANIIEDEPASFCLCHELPASTAHLDSMRADPVVAAIFAEASAR